MQSCAFTSLPTTPPSRPSSSSSSHCGPRGTRSSTMVRSLLTQTTTTRRRSSLAPRPYGTIQAPWASSSADPLHLVGRHLLPVPGSAEDDAQGAWIVPYGLGARDDRRRVVVVRVRSDRTMVDDLVSLGPQ